MSGRPLRFLIFFVMAGLALTSCKRGASPFECADAIGCVLIAPEEPVRVGGIQALSGGAANIGCDQLRSIELALEIWGNRLLGHPVLLQIEDGRCSPEGGKGWTNPARVSRG